MLKLYESKNAEAVILGTRIDSDAATSFGCIVSDSHTKRVLHYVEKPESHISNLINCGVYLFETDTLLGAIKTAIKRRTERPRLIQYQSSENLESSFIADADDEDTKNEVLRLEQDILSDLADSKSFFVLETKVGPSILINAEILIWARTSGDKSRPLAQLCLPTPCTYYKPSNLNRKNSKNLPPQFCHQSSFTPMRK